MKLILGYGHSIISFRPIEKFCRFVMITHHQNYWSLGKIVLQKFGISYINFLIRSNRFWFTEFTTAIPNDVNITNNSIKIELPNKI